MGSGSPFYLIILSDRTTVREPLQTCPGHQFIRGPGIHPEKMRPAAAVRTPESVHLRDPSALLGDACELALPYEVRIRLPCLRTVAYGRETVYVPANALAAGQMTGYPLVKAAHGAAYVTICASTEKVGAEGPHRDVYVPVECHEERVCALPDTHCLAFRESSYATCERVLIRISILLSLILDGVITHTSPRRRP